MLPHPVRVGIHFSFVLERPSCKNILEMIREFFRFEAEGISILIRKARLERANFLAKFRNLVLFPLSERRTSRLSQVPLERLEHLLACLEIQEQRGQLPSVGRRNFLEDSQPT